MRATGFVFLTVLCGLDPLVAAADVDVVVVGAGIGGLTTALRASEQGLRVGVVDMASVFGGHAVMSSGGLSIVGTPLQKEKGIEDSPRLAYQDFLRQGQDANEPMVKLYVERSKELIYDWLTGLGVKFTGVSSGGIGKTGNSAYRFHTNPKLGYGLVAPIYRECLRKGVEFHWNFQVTGLETKAGRVVGVKGTNLRTAKAAALTGQAVVLATGGYESNIELVRKHWPKHLGEAPPKVMLGSGVNSNGSGLALAESVGGALTKMDHQWIYSRGMPDPAHMAEGRGLYVTIPGAIWLNAGGKRFVNEMSATVESIRAVVSQPGGTYWMLFDEAAANAVFVVGPDWQDRKKVRAEVVDNAVIVKTAATLEEAARSAGLPPDAVAASVRLWNEAVASGTDSAFARPMSSPPGPRGAFRLSKIETGPYHLMQIYPLTRKSMGGIAVDLEGRVLSQAGRPVAGLYAVGETTGEGGINGRAALEGTFLGPAIVQGHMAAAHLAASVKPAARAAAQTARGAGDEAGKGLSAECTQCHAMARLTARKRPGYWHFEKLHTVVAGRGTECKACHAEMAPYRAGAHRIDRVAQIDTCVACHLVRE